MRRPPTASLRLCPGQKSRPMAAYGRRDPPGVPLHRQPADLEKNRFLGLSRGGFRVADSSGTTLLALEVAL